MRMILRSVDRWGVAWLVLVSILASGTGSPPAAADVRPSAAGSWQGVIVYTPAELEVEITIELFQGPDGVFAGSIEIPTKPIRSEPLTAIRAEGDAVSWEFHRVTGVFLYRGTLSADGSTIAGTYHERGQDYPFSLTRVDPSDDRGEAEAPPLLTLSASATELESRFNRDVDHVRLILLLSPG